MSIILNDLVKQEDIVERFNTRVRDLVTASTNWISTTPVWNTNVGNVAGNNLDMNDEPMIVYSDAAPTAVATTDLTSIIGAQTTISGHVTNVIKNFLSLYANNHKVTLINTGNLAPASYTGTAKFGHALDSTVSQMQTDFDAAVIANNIGNGKLITATNLNKLIEDCRTIWTNRAFTPVNENLYYYYCHSSCHGSCHSSHGSRGRR